MKLLHLLGAFFIFTTTALAQQNHFIYIQTEYKQPFYVRIGDKLLSSSSAGYIVIPKLQNGTYELNIGFPKNEWAQQKIGITVNNNDAGFTLKNFDTKGWGLFNMQTMDILMATANPVSAFSNDSSHTDGFADVLADVVSTPSIKEKAAAKEKEKKAAKEPVTKTLPVTETSPLITPTEEKPVAIAIKTPVKVSSTLDNSGRSLVYADFFNNHTDTVMIFIPYNTVVKVDNGSPGQPVENNRIEEPMPVKMVEPLLAKETKEPQKEDKKILDIEVPNPNTTTKAITTEPKTEEKQTVEAGSDAVGNKAVVQMINSDCKSNATDDDFLTLRKKMAAQRTDENMIVMAKKGFVTKCYTSEQVSNLGTLFLKDAGRYSFFDAAYAHVSDTQNFGSLVSKLSDEYYINRFKAMLRH